VAAIKLVAMADEQTARARRADQILADAGAVIHDDHFVYINGDHGEGWIAKDLIFPHTEAAGELCAMLAEAVSGRRFEIVCGPATGGLIVAMWTAHELGLPFVFAEHGKEQGYDPRSAAPGPLRPPFVLKRGYDEWVRNRKVLVVDDVVNTGESVRETVEVIAAAGGEVVAVAALCTRGNAGPADVGSDDLVYLTEVAIPSWPAAECELCRRGVPVNTRYAHGADFLAAQAAPSG
jgi:orotate phosphoribosyltransferase